MELSRHEEPTAHGIDRRTVLAGALGVGVLLVTGCGRSGARGDGTPTQPTTAPPEAEPELWTPAQPEIIVDSAMTLEEALAGKEMPAEIRAAQTLVGVEYNGFDGLDHRGQLVVHEDVADEVSDIFAELHGGGFVIEAVVPVVAYSWSDGASMAANNTSGFNYRTVPGSDRLSKHALGLAVDLNPGLNPFNNNGHIEPEGAKYIPGNEGVIEADGLIVDAFESRSWKWGGNWRHEDYQHFEKSA